MTDNIIILMQILTLAAVQGLTEFLPISSSGHLVLLQNWFGRAEGDLFLDIVLHCGTLGSVLWVYRREVKRLLVLDSLARRYVGSLILGTLPAILVGLTVRDLVASLFTSSQVVAVAFLVTAGILFSTRFAKGPSQENNEPWRPQPVRPLKALIIGTAQALAITPGVSRSGATISASLWVGLPRAEAARFSFLLSIPAVGGALVLELLQGVGATRVGWGGLLLGALTAFGVGLLAIRWTALAVVQRHFWKFFIYCLLLGTTLLVVGAVY